jgi:hypothetical protein
MKTYEENKGQAPCNLNFGSRWKRVSDMLHIRLKECSPDTHEIDFMVPRADLERKTKRTTDDSVENRILAVQPVARHPAYPSERTALNYGSYVGAGCF